jgi:hypothetical protein
MTSSKTAAYAAAAFPFLMMAAIVGLLMLCGAGGESAGGTAACGSGPSAAGQPPLIQYYVDAAAKYRLGTDGYAYLAAINEVETTFGTNLAVSSAGAIGWMQFEPGTWAQYAVSVTDPSGKADPDDPQDAIYTAARYLHASGAPGSWSTATFAYNHSHAYVQEVLARAQRYSGPHGMTDLQDDIAAAWGNQPQPQWSTPAQTPGARVIDVTYIKTAVASDTCDPVEVVDDITPVNGSQGVIMPNGLARPGKDAPASVQAMVDAGDRITSLAYSYGGGHCAAAMNQTAPDPDACPGEEENGTPGFDCSSSTSYILWGGGYASVLDNEPQVSGNFMTIGAVGADPQGWVTWYATTGHVFIEVDDLVMDTVPGPTEIAPKSAPSTGPRWQASSQVQWELTNDNVGTFVARHLENI